MSNEEDETPLIRRMGVEGSSSKLQIKDYIAGIVALIVVCLGVAAIVIVCVYQILISYEYGIVLDAGSTHTDLMVYRWSKKHVIHGTGQVEQVEKCTSQGGSISSYMNKDPSQAGSSLQSCIDGTAKKLIPIYQQHETPIYLGATAGMRLVDEVNKTISMKIMSSVRQTLRKSPFKFEDSYARIISGVEEGISSWVTVNYLQGKLFYREISPNTSESNAHLNGALDMGGASTQITFTPNMNEIILPQSLYEIKLYGRSHQLYTHSYLCYGKREAERRFMASLIPIKDSFMQSNPIDNPCGPVGLTQNISLAYLTKPPCVKVHLSGSPVNSTIISFRGTSNVSQCVQQVQKLFNFSQCASKQNCSFNGVYQPSTEAIKYLAFSSYYYTISNLNLTEEKKINITLGKFKKAADKLCTQTWAAITRGKPPSVRTLLKTACLDAQYVYTLLNKGYHIKDNSTQVKFQNSINSYSLGWAMGFMINATNLIPSEKPEYRVKTEAFLAVVIVGAILISLGILIIIMATRRVIDRRQIQARGLAI